MLEDKKVTTSSKSIKILDEMMMDDQYNEMGIPEVVNMKRSSVDALNIHSIQPTSESKGKSIPSNPFSSLKD